MNIKESHQQLEATRHRLWLHSQYLKIYEDQLALLTRAGGEIALDVAIGSCAARLPALRAPGDRGRITLHVDPRPMAAVAADTRMAVGARRPSLLGGGMIAIPNKVGSLQIWMNCGVI